MNQLLRYANLRKNYRKIKQVSNFGPIQLLKKKPNKFFRSVDMASYQSDWLSTSIIRFSKLRNLHEMHIVFKKRVDPSWQMVTALQMKIQFWDEEKGTTHLNLPWNCC